LQHKMKTITEARASFLNIGAGSTHLTDADVELLRGAGFFNFLQNDFASISVTSLQEARLGPEVDLGGTFIINVACHFFTLSYRGFCGEKQYAVYLIRQSDGLDVADYLLQQDDAVRAQVMAGMTETDRAAAIAALMPDRPPWPP